MDYVSGTVGLKELEKRRKVSLTHLSHVRFTLIACNEFREGIDENGVKTKRSKANKLFTPFEFMRGKIERRNVGNSIRGDSNVKLSSNVF